MDLTTYSDEELAELTAAANAEKQRRFLISQAGNIVSQLEEVEPTQWEDLIDRISPGQRVVFNGNVWRNVSGAWLSAKADPNTYPTLWSQETGVSADVP